ncbi:MAG: IclR family transcriptional regulator [Rhodospirillaceae bacterium]|nr:IclR family transcriptional regulator [Rhodospirillaceae bacterium]
MSRIFAVLEILVAVPKGATLSELAAQAGAPKTSLVGLLAGLIAEGCLVRDRDGRYSLGPRFVSLATRVVAGRELTMVARPILADLMQATGETAVLGAVAPDMELVTYLDKVESDNPIRYAVTVGERRDLYCTAMGKVLLAYFETSRLKRYFKDTKRQQFTETTITTAAGLMSEMKGIRSSGIATTDNERVAGASGVAGPVFSGDGAVVAGVMIAGPSDRMRANAAENEIHVRAAAAACTRLIGGAPLEDIKERNT